MSTTELVSAAVAIASAAGGARVVTPELQAYDVLAEFRRIVPWSCIELAAWDSRTRTHRSVVQIDYPDDVLAHVNGRTLVEDVSWSGLVEERRTKAWKSRSADFDLASSRLYSEVLKPANLLEGMFVPLYSSTGAYAGMVTCNLDTWKFPTPDLMTIADQLAPSLSRLLDQFALDDVDADDCSEAERVALVDDSDGFTAELRTGAAVPMRVREAVTWANRLDYQLSRFMIWPADRDHPTRISVTRGSGLSSSMLVGWRDAPAPRTVTKRQLEVITAIADGLSNDEIARRLTVSTRTVTTHVENILQRLGLPGRAAVVRAALTEGLYLAPSS